MVNSLRNNIRLRKSQECASELQYLPMEKSHGDLETQPGTHGVEGSLVSDGGKRSNSTRFRGNPMNKQPAMYTIKIQDASDGGGSVEKNSVNRRAVERNSTKLIAHSMNGRNASLPNLNPLLLSGRSS
jgi:hypothetical protein